jgi:hypothetical protein
VTDNYDDPVIDWDYVEHRFRAYLTMNGQRSYLGSFQSLEDAFTARTQAAWNYVYQFTNNP